MCRQGLYFPRVFVYPRFSFSVNKLTITTARVARMKETSLTVRKLFSTGMFAQTIVETAPVIIPASTPSGVVLGHFRARRIAGPKDAPSPDHCEYQLFGNNSKDKCEYPNKEGYKP